MPALIPALIVGAAGVAGSAISAGAANKASNTAANTAAADNALQEKIYNENSANEQPYIAAGDQASDELNGFLGLGGDPAKTQAAYDTYLNSTGYDFAKQQGLDGAEQTAAAKGLYNSGAALKALDAYGTGEAETYGQNYVTDLNAVATRGAGSANALAGTGQSYANAVSSNNNTAAGVEANADLKTASSENSLISSAINAFGYGRGTSSFGGAASGASGGAANVFNGVPVGG
jgi:hypothetical protein